MDCKNTDVWGFRHVARSLVNSGFTKESDSGVCRGGDYGIGCNNCAMSDKCIHEFDHTFQLGKNDLVAMQKLIDDDKTAFLDMIHVSADIIKSGLRSAIDMKTIRESETITIDTTYLDVRENYLSRNVNGYKSYCNWIRSLPYGEELIMYKGEVG